MPISINVLGALSVANNDGEPIKITAANQRRALLYLVLRANEVVSVDQLADAVWCAEPPAVLEHSVHSLVYRLRRGLFDDERAEASIRRADPGYCLSIDPHQIDSHRFTTDVRRALALLATDPASTRDVLSATLAQWRGDALLDVAYDTWAIGEIRRLSELRLTACEALAEANIALGQGELSIAELESLTERFPMRESLWDLLWRAMSTSGRRLDVIASHRRAVELLTEQCSTHPSPHLAELARRYAEAGSQGMKNAI